MICTITETNDQGWVSSIVKDIPGSPEEVFARLVQEHEVYNDAEEDAAWAAWAMHGCVEA